MLPIPRSVMIAGGPMFGHYAKDAFQELDLVSMFKPVTKLSVLVNKPERLPELLYYAFRTAMSGRKGPVFIDIPRDVLNHQMLHTSLLSTGAIPSLSSPTPPS